MLDRMSIAEKISIFSFFILLMWWVVLYFILAGQYVEQNLYWAATYQLMAWWGGVFGLMTSRSWGGFKSLMGRAIIFFSIGLVFQGFGQTTFSIYTTLLGQELPYPSIADIGYFGSVFWYLLGIISLAKVAGASVTFKSLSGKLQAIFLPAFALFISYAYFLQGYEFDWSSPLKIVLDFGYPLGEAVYVAIAMLTLLFSYKILGGVMRLPLTFLMMALIAQYAAEFNFLSQVSNSTWVNGGYGDVMYLFAYFLMAVSLVHIEQALTTYRSDSVT